MKNLIEFIHETLLSPKNREHLKKTAASAEEYYDDPPMSASEAISRMGGTGRAYWDGQEKMDMWHDGKRKENIKACKPEKLIMYWEICTQRKYKDQLDDLEEEANRRGWTFKKLKR